MSIEAEKVQMDLDDLRLKFAQFVQVAKPSSGFVNPQIEGDATLIEQVLLLDKQPTPESPAEPKKDK